MTNPHPPQDDHKDPLALTMLQLTYKVQPAYSLAAAAG